MAMIEKIFPIILLISFANARAAVDPQKPTILCQALLKKNLLTDWKRPVELVSHPSVVSVKRMVRLMTDPQNFNIQIYNPADGAPPIRGNIFAKGNYMDAVLVEGVHWSEGQGQAIPMTLIGRILKEAHDQVYPMASGARNVLINPELRGAGDIRKFLEEIEAEIRGQVDERMGLSKEMDPKERLKHFKYPGLRLASVVGLSLTTAMLVYVLRAPPELRNSRIVFLVASVLVVAGMRSEVRKYERNYPKEDREQILADPVPIENESRIVSKFLNESNRILQSGKSGDFVFTSLPQTIYWPNESNPDQPIATNARVVLLTFKDENGKPSHLALITADNPETVQRQVQMAKGVGLPVESLLTFDGATDFSAPSVLIPDLPKSTPKANTFLRTVAYLGLAIASGPPAYLIYQMVFGR